MSLSPGVALYVLDPLERAGRTFVQQFVTVLLATGAAMVTQNWLLALDSAGFAALISVLTSVLTFAVPPQRAVVDLVLRVGKTFVQSLVGTLAASGVLLTQADWRGAVAVALPAAFAALVSAGVPSLIPAGVARATEQDYQPGPTTDPDVELNEDGTPVFDDNAHMSSAALAAV